MCVAAIFLAMREHRVLPVTLSDDDPYSEESQRLDDKRRAEELAAAILKKQDFRNTRMSGSEVIAKALAIAKKDGDDLSDYGEPQIALREKDGRLVWFVSFYRLPGFPGGFFTIGIDDTSGETTVYPGM